MSTKKLFGITVLILAIVIFGGYYAYQSYLYVSTDNAQVGAHVTMLSCRVNGTVQKVHVEENQRVKAGELLAEIDTSDYSNALEEAEAQVASLKARFREAELNYRRSENLVRNLAVSQERFDNAKAQYKDQEAKLKAAQAQLEQASLNVSYTKVIAPTDGIIAKKSVEKGQFVPVGQPLFGFVETNERWVIANLKETELENVRLGSKAYITVDAISDRKFVGSVESISPSTGALFSLLPPDNATGNFTKVVQRIPVRIKLDSLSDDDAEALRAGLSVVVAIRVR
jgi:membrane fusion protein, multidrug efflux system